MHRGALIASLIAAAVGVALLFAYKQRFEAETSGGPRQAVLIAAGDLPLGEVLSRDMIAVREIPAAYVESRHIRAADSRRVLGVRVSRSLRANESILWSDLAVATEDGRTLAGLVRPGMRALAVPATVSSTFGGLLRPGDRVDAFLTTSDRDPTKRVTLPLLQNLLVLAVGGDVGMAYEAPATDDDRWRAPHLRMSTISVAVTPRQAELLAYAQELGVLTMALRNPGDVTIIDGLPEATYRDVIEPTRRAELQQRRPGVRRATTEDHAIHRLE
jgi:pilus assembly protein CpaB